MVLLNACTVSQTCLYNVPDRNDQDEYEDEDDYDADTPSTEDNYQLMEMQDDLEKIKTENSKDGKIPIVINATKRDISSNAESGSQGGIIGHDSGLYIGDMLLSAIELLHLVISQSVLLILIIVPTEGRCLVCAKIEGVGHNDASGSGDKFTFYTKYRLFKYTGTSCEKSFDGGGVFLQFKNVFALMGAKLNSSLENSLMNLEKKICDLGLEQHDSCREESSELLAELLQHNEQGLML
uniref:Uncharacterized protein n=1 Tax=Glossina morsitans morsitans TaxID=37546 RepID=A0A1B0G5Z5_GLOMM